MRSLLGPLLLQACAAVNVAIANIRGSTGAIPVSGFVRFEQPEDDPLADVTVTISVTGLTAGEHGFHVHQFGDVRSTTDLSSMAAHFVPFCIPPEINITSGELEGADCASDQVHGFPPSRSRQPGDMGNVTATGAAGAVQRTLVIGQQKMSLTHPLRSIVGRVVVFHSLPDDGTQPYGNAGVPQAYGVIGMARPADGVTNAVQAPTTPKVDKVICTFEGAYPGSPATGASLIQGHALLRLLEPYRPGYVRMEARIVGLNRETMHSFHFHTWGDMTVSYDQLGDIYSSNAIDVDEIAVDIQGVAYFLAEFRTDSLLEHVGRSLTIHQGSSRATPTLAAAACGLANPRATVDMTGAPSFAVKRPMSAGATFLVVLTTIICGSFLITALLYYMRLPIPICGRWLYAHEMAFGSMPPPPPPPDDMYGSQGSGATYTGGLKQTGV